MKFNLFFKSLGNKEMEYHYPLAHVESDNVQEVVEMANFICKEMNIPVKQMGVDLNVDKDYPRQQTSTTGINERGFKKFFKSST